MLDDGFFVRLGSASPQAESPLRISEQVTMAQGGLRRSQQSFIRLVQCANALLLVHFPAVVIRRVVFGSRPGHVLRAIVAISRRIADCFGRQRDVTRFGERLTELSPSPNVLQTFYRNIERE